MRSLLVVVLLAAACSSPSTPTGAVVSPSASVSAITVTPTASASAHALKCSLPITWAVNSGQSYLPKHGFLHFPDLAINEDSSAAGVFYDRAFARWLPVSRNQVSYDGTRYAYATGNAFLGTSGSLHVVEVATGADRTLFTEGPVYQILDFGPAGIFMTPAAPEGRPRGLWLQDPTGGAAHLINNSVEAPSVSAGTGWGLDFDNTDPSPAPGGLEGPVNRLLQVDLRTGSTTPRKTWFGADIWLGGTDYSGNAFVDVAKSSPDGASTTQELWQVSSSGVAQRLFSGPGNQPWPFQLAAIDNHGMWFNGGYFDNSTGAVWLYSGAQITAVATVNLIDVRIAGGCIDG